MSQGAKPWDIQSVIQIYYHLVRAFLVNHIHTKKIIVMKRAVAYSYERHDAPVSSISSMTHRYTTTMITVKVALTLSLIRLP